MGKILHGTPQREQLAVEKLRDAVLEIEPLDERHQQYLAEVDDQLAGTFGAVWVPAIPARTAESMRPSRIAMQMFQKFAFANLYHTVKRGGWDVKKMDTVDVFADRMGEFHMEALLWWMFNGKEPSLILLEDEEQENP